ncbi:putative methyltransferase NSUN7 isoform X2 [Ptychodera flava]|uniref:putative methyltransferase NSUN7 isoform X2 n=1 Tax=Ptychodera flava TaxID=63121 RepID=UPI00396A2F5C
MSVYTESRSSFGHTATMMSTLNGINRADSVPIAVLKEKDVEGNFQENERRSQSFQHISQPNGRDANHGIYLYASQLFASLKPQTKSERLSDSDNWCQDAKPPQIPPNEEKYRRHVYDLAFATLKYQALLEDILLDSGYYSYYSTPDENHALTMVILQDMQDRRFAKRHKMPDEPFIDHVSEVEDDLNAYKTKLNAALAKNRIKFKAPSIEFLLPENVRERETKAVATLVYAWVNQIKTDISTVIDTLKEEGFKEVKSDDKLTEQTFCVDVQCKNVLIFHSDIREELENHQLFKEYHLIMQDKSSCYGPHSVKALLNEGDDVIHTHVGSGKITAHMSSLMNQEGSTVFAFGLKNHSHHETLKGRMEQYGVKNIRGVEENFLDVLPTDVRFKNVKVILMTPPCSHSGITNPVDYILHEGEDASILQDLSRDEVDQDKLNEIINEQMEYLKHAMRFSRVQAVIYCTHSINHEENENVVTKVADYFNSKLTAKQMPYRITPPTLPLSVKDADKQESSKYFKTKPTEKTSGCFVAVVTREATPDDQLTAADIIARAKAKGLMGAGGTQPSSTEENGESPEGGKRKKKSGQRSPRSKSTPSMRRGVVKGKHSPPNRNLRTSPTRPLQRKPYSQQHLKERSSKTSLQNTSSEDDYRQIKTVARKPRTATVPAGARTGPKVELKVRQFAWQKL